MGLVRAAVVEAFSIYSVYDSRDSVLGDPEVDGVHIVTGLPDQADYVIATLDEDIIPRVRGG